MMKPMSRRFKKDNAAAVPITRTPRPPREVEWETRSGFPHDSRDRPAWRAAALPREEINAFIERVRDSARLVEVTVAPR
ncbi:MAG: hypothetical protein D6718_10295 [Acidobacteria bacterium]|nr:MAG: hypothetical protein D6718_10295 [Acidobacteriota bacterium]